MTTRTTPAGSELGAAGPDAAVARLVHWLETGEGAEETFASDCFLDLSLPQWRIQSDTREALVAVRRDGHPAPGRVRVERVDRTGSGFVIAFEERWSAAGQEWYCRELIRADVAGGRITELAAACTGDWDEEVQARHARDVSLLRP